MARGETDRSVGNVLPVLVSKKESEGRVGVWGGFGVGGLLLPYEAPGPPLAPAL